MQWYLKSYHKIKINTSKIKIYSESNFILLLKSEKKYEKWNPKVPKLVQMITDAFISMCNV